MLLKLPGGGATGSYGGASGTFGVGAIAPTTMVSGAYGGAGGGGGWYGGGSTNGLGSAGGGSGYVYTASTLSNYPNGCLLNSKYYLTGTSMIAGNVTMQHPDGRTEIGHDGNGFVRITKVA